MCLIGYWMHQGYWGGNIIMWILTLLVLVLVGFLIYQAVKQNGKLPVQETPLEVLKKRYAKGEIDKQEFERIKSDINNS